MFLELGVRQGMMIAAIAALVAYLRQSVTPVGCLPSPETAYRTYLISNG